MSRGATAGRVGHGRPPTEMPVVAFEGEINSPALKRLQQMKAKIQEELQQAEAERQAAQQEDTIIPLSLVDEYKDNKGRKGAKLPAMSGVQGDKPAKSSKGTARQRDMDILVEAHEKERRALELHNQRLRSIIELRQQSSQRKEAKCEEEIALLKRKLDTTLTSAFDPQSTMANLRVMNEQIQEQISQLQSTIEQQAEVEKMNLVRQYRVKMHELRKELAEEERAIYAGAQEWIEKNNSLKAELDQASETLEQVTQSNVKLAMENKELKVKFQQQEEERKALVTQVTTVRKENKRLVEQLRLLEDEAIETAKNLKMSHDEVSALPTEAPVSTTRLADYEAKYLEMINKVKRQIELERRTLKQVRTSHIELLQERTELEVFLRQCLQDVRREIARNTAAGPNLAQVSNRVLGRSNRYDTSLEGYTVADRRKLLDLLMSKERVIALLYSRAFPFKLPKESLADELDVTPSLDAVVSSSAEVDMDTLWRKWKDWTDRVSST